MTAEELAERISARELTEWAAYEDVYGPVGPAWRDETAAVLVEEVRRLTQTLVAVNTDKKDRDQIPPVEPHPRPDGHTPAPEPRRDPDEDLDEFEDDEEEDDGG